MEFAPEGYSVRHAHGETNRVPSKEIQRRIFLNSVEKALHSCCPGAPDHSRLGAISFVHRFGSALNGNIHIDEIHPCILPFRSLRGPNPLLADLSLLRHRGGLFSSEGEGVRFDEAAINAEAIAKVQVRERVLRLFQRRALLSSEAVDAMRAWGHDGGYS